MIMNLLNITKKNIKEKHASDVLLSMVQEIFSKGKGIYYIKMIIVLGGKLFIKMLKNNISVIHFIAHLTW